MPTEDDVRRQIDHELFAEREIASVAELAGEYDRDQNLVPMVLGGSGPVRDIIQEMLEMEIPDEWKERYSLPPDKKTQAEVSTTLDSPPARQNWLDTEPDVELVEQVPTEEREQWREMEAGAIDRRLADMDKNWMEMAQLCGLDGEPIAVRIFRDEKLLPALDRWKPVIGAKHYKRLSTKWTARLNAREMEFRRKQVPTVAEATTPLTETDRILARAMKRLSDPSNPPLDAKEVCAVTGYSEKAPYRLADEERLQRVSMGKVPGKRAKFLVTAESVRKLLEEIDE